MSNSGIGRDLTLNNCFVAPQIKDAPIFIFNKVSLGAKTHQKGGGIGYDFSFTKIDKNLMDVILNERWSGKNYSERIWGNTDILADSLCDVISSGMMSGQGIEKMSKQIKDRFKVSKYYAERLIRTEVNHFNNMADAMAYEDMGVEYYVFVATLDNRTSEICQTMDGKKFAYKDKEEGVNYPPLHPNCRSKTRGYVDEETERRLKRRARNPITGKTEVIDNISYKQWLKGVNTLKTNPNTGIINISIDEFTSCLKRNSDGKLIDTYFKKINKNDVDKFTKDWLFDWKKQQNVYGLYTKDNNQLQGLVSYFVDRENQAYCVNLVENAPHNKTTKDYTGVGAHLFAEVCRRSKKQGYGGYIYFDAKTNLVDYYKRELNAKLVGNTRRMIIDEEEAEELIKKYYGAKRH